MTQLGGIHLYSFPVSPFRFREVVRLRVGIAEKIEQGWRRRTAGDAFEKQNGVRGFPFIEEKLRELLDGGLVLRVLL